MKYKAFLKLIVILFVSISVSLIATDVETALSYYKEGKIASAALIFEKFAQTNDPFALSRLGLLHMRGHGFKRSYPKAFKYFKKASEKGSGLADYYLSVFYSYGSNGVCKKDQSKANEFLRQSAERGYAFGQFSYAVNLLFYYKKQKRKEALSWLNKAAKSGVAGAFYDCGQCTARAI